MEVQVDLTNGTDNSITAQGITQIFKTLDCAYQKSRELYPDSLIKFVLLNGYQYLTLDKYQNCVLSGTDYVKINKSVELVNVIFDIEVTSQLPRDGLISILTREKVSFNKKLTVSEINYTLKRTYHEIIFINNEGVLCINEQANIKVSRKFTFVNNKLKSKVVFPNVESQGGALFNSDEGTKTRLIGKEANHIIIHNSISRGYVYNTRIYNDFVIINYFNNLLVIDVNLKFKYDQKVILFNSKNSVLDNKYPLDCINAGDVMSIRNTSIESENVTILSNVDNITKINTKLYSVNYINRKIKVKTIKNNYILTDDDSDIFHINDVEKDINIVIPDELSLDGREIYFRKINEINKNRIFIKSGKIKNFVVGRKLGSRDSEGRIILDKHYPEVCMYEHDGGIYIK